MRKASNAIAADFLEYAKDQGIGTRLRLARVVVRGNWTFFGMIRGWGEGLKEMGLILVGRK